MKAGEAAKNALDDVLDAVVGEGIVIVCGQGNNALWLRCFHLSTQFQAFIVAVYRD